MGASRAEAQRRKSKALTSLAWQGMSRGMTLVELLLCIAIVGVLTALVTSAALGGKKHAKRVVCLNNIRQMAAADILHSLDVGSFPEMSPFVPSSIGADRLKRMAEYLGVSVPAGPVSSWPRRNRQPKWMNCPMAVDSGIAEGLSRREWPGSVRACGPSCTALAGSRPLSSC